VTIVLVLLALGLLRIGIVFVGATLIIRPATRCPACFHDTLAIRRRWLERMSSRYEWRWCPECQWQGVALKIESVGGRRVNG
jgi:hypothetical protein